MHAAQRFACGTRLFAVLIMRCRVCITSHDFECGSACGRGTWQVACLCVAPRVVSGSAPALVHSLLARAKWLISGACTVHQAARSRVWHHPLFCLFEGVDHTKPETPLVYVHADSSPFACQDCVRSHHGHQPARARHGALTISRPQMTGPAMQVGC